MKRGLPVLIALAALIAAPLAFALLAEEPVFNFAKNERHPAADHDGTGAEVWLFTRSRDGYPNRYDAYFKKEGEAAVKLNRAGQGWTGGIAYPLAVYQQTSRNSSDLRFYHVDSNTRSAPPVNTAKWEWHPTVTGTADDYHLLFGRDDLSSPTQRVVLHHHSTAGAHDTLRLDTVTRASHFLQPDQINGGWATYTRCKPRCNVVRYNIVNEVKNVVPKPLTTRPRHQYAGAVTSSGAVYLVRSGPNCGERVRIVRYSSAHGDPTLGTVVAALPTGIDIATAYARENTDGSVDIFYDRVKCSTGRWDVYKVTDPAPGP